MHQGALVYFLWLLFIIFLAVLLLITVNIIKLNRERRGTEPADIDVDVDIGGNEESWPVDDAHKSPSSEARHERVSPTLARRNEESGPGGLPGKIP